jgi:hypothetical protein
MPLIVVDYVRSIIYHIDMQIYRLVYLLHFKLKKGVWITNNNKIKRPACFVKTDQWHSGRDGTRKETRENLFNA